MTKTTYYFLGIGGIGMSALARHFLHQQHRVYGYDKTSTSLTRDLEALGITITYDEGVDAIPNVCMSTETQIIYTPALPKTHPQLVYFQKHSYSVKKRAEVLGSLSKSMYTIAVGGTHGKTTTTALLAHLMHATNQSFTAFVGGVLKGFESNYIATGTDYLLVEADEYDRSFLQLHPAQIAITSMDADHLDIYTTAQNLRDTFVTFSQSASEGLVHAEGLPLSGLTYGFGASVDYRAKDLSRTEEGFEFTLITPGGTFSKTRLPMLGQHNLMNALGALALGHQLGFDVATMANALADFQGIQRRMNRFTWQNKILIDDYAHHPEEIQAVYNALRTHYTDLKIGVVFQPHLFSRTQDFWTAFCQVLELFDTVALMDIYPARERPIAGITTDRLLDALSHQEKTKLHPDQMATYIQTATCDLIAVLGAGDIGTHFQNLIQTA